MDRSSDLNLRRMLKKWATDSKPPENGRARLLWEAAHASKKKTATSVWAIKLQSDEHSTSQLNNWSQTLFFSWVFEHSIQSGMAVRLC
jgi:hypothetical protein